jgi:hypothetical protein
MRCTRSSLLSVAGLSVALAAAGCGGGSSTVTGPDETPIAAGAAVIQGTVVGGSFAGSSGDVTALSGDRGLTVAVEGTPLFTGVDEEGEFILSSVPAGSVTLVFEGSGVNARLTVSGLLDGQVMSLEVHVSGSGAQVTTPAYCTPTKTTKITGILESMAGSQLVVGGHPVDASEVSKVWRGGRRINLENLVIGEKVKVWGTLKGDGVLVAEEIKALSEGEKTWVTLEGRVTGVASSSRDVHADPNTGSGSCATASVDGVHANPYSSCPTFSVDGQKVVTDSGTKFKKADGSALDPQSITVGQKAYVEGWQKPEGPVVAEKVVIG